MVPWSSLQLYKHSSNFTSWALFKIGILHSNFSYFVNYITFVYLKRGLIFQTLKESIYELIVKQLRQHQNTMEDKFIVCLNKTVKHFPPLADKYDWWNECLVAGWVCDSSPHLMVVCLLVRFMNSVFFLLPKFHGVMKTLCLEVVLCRAEMIADLYLQLKSKDFVQLMKHRWVDRTGS